MRIRLCVFLWSFIAVVFCALNASAEIPAQPAAPTLVQATFTKIIVKWTPVDGAASYRLYRNEVAVASGSATEFTDTGLTADTAYAYKLTALNADGESLASAVLSVRTLKNLSGDNSAVVQQVVDMVNPNTVSGDSLIGTVQGSLNLLNVMNTDLLSVDTALLRAMIDRELELARQPDDPADTSTETLEEVMTKYYNSHTFMDLYIREKIGELAETHWQAGKKETALALYEKSLTYMTDVEQLVCNTLVRIAYINFAHITAESSRENIAAALAQYNATVNRYFEFFPNASMQYSTMIHLMAAHRHFQYFPKLLEYDNYSHTVFDTALSHAQTVATLNNNDKYSVNRVNRIASWQLGAMLVSIVNSQGAAAPGTLTVTNVSPKNFVLSNTDYNLDERVFNITTGSVNIPIYLGHSYDLTASFPVEGGNPLVYKISSVPHAAGKRTVYNQLNAPVTVALPEANGAPEVMFVTDRPTFPYNLKAAVIADSFTLSWDWVAPSAQYLLKNFTVYRGGVAIGTTATQSFAGIPVESDNLTYTYTVRAVDINDQLSAESPMLTVLPVMTPELQAYYAWKLKYFGTQPVYAHQDSDNDGLTNWEEYLLGSNPVQAPVADPKSALTNITPGLKVRYFAGTWSTLPNFESLTPFATTVLTNINFGDNYANILTSGLADNVGLVAEGYFDVTVAGNYRFYLVSDDAGRVIIDNTTVIDMNTSGWHDRYADLPLQAGSHSIRVEYVEKADRARLNLYWSGPNFAQKLMNSGFWHTTDTSPILGEVIAWQRDSDRDGVRDLDELKLNTSRTSNDSDGDGLTDYEEIYVYHTNPLAADSDADGVSDYVEVKLAFTNPNVADFNGNVTEIAAVNGAAATASTAGAWEKSGSAIYAVARNGWLEYTVNLPQAGTYGLEVSGTQQNSLTAQNTFDLEAAADGVTAGRRTLTATAGTVGKVLFFLPALTAGNHTVRLTWNNVSSNTFLQINSIRVVALGGPDADANGNADWIDNRNANLAQAAIPAESKTSPVCVEGANAARIDAVTFSGFYTAPETTPVTPVAIRAAGNRWYANLDLDPVAAATSLTVNFADSGKTVTQNVVWTPTNVLVALAEPLKVRVGDSLKLTAVPTEAGATGTVNISVNGVTQTVTANTAVYKFTAAGNYTVEATFTPETGTPVSGTITVKAVAATFAAVPYALVGFERNWSNPNIPADAALESDPGLILYRAASGAGCNLAFYGQNVGPAWITARLGEHGAVLASTRVDIVDCNTHKNDGYYKLIDTFDDGSKLIEGRIVLTEVPADLRIYLKLATAGTTFDDGTIERWVTAADFDANGVYRYRMLKAPTSVTSTCHTINFYQGSALVNSYRNW